MTTISNNQLLAAIACMTNFGLRVTGFNSNMFKDGMGGTLEVVDANDQKRIVAFDVYPKGFEGQRWKYPVMKESVLFFGNTPFCVANADFFMMANPEGTACVFAKREDFNMNYIYNDDGKKSYGTRNFRYISLEERR